MEKTCPRCGSLFDCKNNNITKCHCVHVTISPEGYQHIKDKYKDCLCMNCLREIEKGLKPLPK